MGAVLGERGDDVPERGQRLVDARRLAQPLAARTRLALPLAARQVHQVQLAYAGNINKANLVYLQIYINRYITIFIPFIYPKLKLSQETKKMEFFQR